MPARLTTVERAFELARSGQHMTIEAIVARLKYEGYYDGAVQLSGKYIRRQLRDVMPPGDAR